MFSFLKHLLGKQAGTPPENQGLPEPSNAAPAWGAPGAAPVFDSRVAPSRNNGYHNGRGVEVPLRAILRGLPLELQPRVLQTEVGDLAISVPLEKILSQLARGVVKLTFGELRHAAPQIFSSEPDRDRVLVPLPLSEILARLNPALMARRRVQKQVQVPEEISSPFDPTRKGLTAPASSPTPEPSSVSATPPPQAPPAVRHVSPPPEAPPISLRSTTLSAPTPIPPTAPPLQTPTALPGGRPLSMADTPPPTTPAVARLAKPTGEPAPLVVNLALLAEAWPEAVRREIVQLSLIEAKVALPAPLVERGLRQGKLVFTWKQLRSWIKPSPLPSVSAQDNAMLEMPLKVVAPPFLARRQKNPKSPQKVAIDESIPNLFFGFPQPEARPDVPGPSVPGPSLPATAPAADTNYYVWEDTADTVRVHESEVKRNPSAGTRFVTKYATPNEIVSRAAALDGVAGALIALPDGLLVASRLPSDLNSDTLAAFLPQIFGKVSQCTKELRMGELNNLNFTVGRVPWKIFRVNATFFAAFGRAGESLPTAQLAALAAELDHKPK